MASHSVEQFTVWYRCNGRPCGTHSGFRSLIDACEAAMDAVHGVWSAADEAKVSDSSDRIVARYAAENVAANCHQGVNRRQSTN